MQAEGQKDKLLGKVTLPCAGGNPTWTPPQPSQHAAGKRGEGETPDSSSAAR